MKMLMETLHVGIVANWWASGRDEYSISSLSVKARVTCPASHGNTSKL